MAVRSSGAMWVVMRNMWVVMRTMAMRTMTMAMAMKTLSRSSKLAASSEWESILKHLCGIKVDISICFGIWSIFIDNTEDCRWDLLWVLDLQEGVIVWLGLFAIGTVIEILANTALISDADDWELSTTIALTFLMDYLAILALGLLFLVGSFREHLTGLFLELFLDELFENLFRHSVFLAFFVAFSLFVLWLRWFRVRSVRSAIW